jgi:hypothetical protein
VRFVESDDNGWFWDKSQAAGTMDLIRASASRMDTFVIVFVHGWHHSAECCDGNVEGFKETLERLHEELSKKMYETARNTIQHGPGWSPQFKLIGVYVGWRGSSLPGLIDYTTFFGRKAAAGRVGETDLREFLVRLNGFRWRGVRWPIGRWTLRISARLRNKRNPPGRWLRSRSVVPD